MKLYEIEDTSKWTSNRLFKTVEEAKKYIIDLVGSDIKQGNVNRWEDDFIICELDTKWMMKKEHETIEIEEIKKSL